MPGTSERQDLRLAELLATVSLATDLAHDVPPESALRDALLATQLARLAGWPREDLSDVYYLALLYHVGCTGAVSIQSRFGAGDDVAVRKWLSEVDYSSRPEMMRVSMSRLARRWGPGDWARGMVQFITLGETVPEAFASLADVAVRLSERLQASPAVSSSLRHAYARWDGRVFPGVPSGPDLPRIARLVHLVHVARRHHHLGGVDAADAVVRGRRGTELDPELADLWLASSRDLLRAASADASVWDEALAAEPDPWRMVARSHLDEVSRALADFADLKTPYMHGHSARLARLVEAAALEAGLDQEATGTVRRAAEVHDLGNVSIPDRIWIKRGSLAPAEWERIRLHAYHSQRIISLSPSLRPSGEIAGLHHERLDSTGYHRGLPASAIPLAARLLMVGEAYQSMLEERPWRGALSRDEAAAELRREESSGRFDHRAVEAILIASGEPARRGRAARSWPADLTDREVDVLRLLARGLSNRQVASALHVSAATVHTHVINVYGKIGVNTRAGATLFALEHDLIQVPSGRKDQPDG